MVWQYPRVCVFDPDLILARICGPVQWDIVKQYYSRIVGYKAQGDTETQTFQFACNSKVLHDQSLNMTGEASKLRRPQIRAPVPSLFVGPPSRNASATSLQPPPGANYSSARVPLLRKQTAPDADLLQQRTTKSSSGAGGAPSTDAVWAEMQNTLGDVELNGMSGANVFGVEHAKALEELRAAQIELARAWARSEVDDAEGQVDGEDVEREHLGMEGTSVLASERIEKLGKGAGKVAKGKGKGGEADAGKERARSQLEEETRNDILLARQRRLANDKYFERVNKGVVDVVARLDVVAKKMGQVETESQEIWGDKESVG